MKAFHCKDGKVRVFASDENSVRLNKGADRLNMPWVPLQLFRDTVDETIRLNAEYVPPYGTNGAMYIRPVLFGCGPQLGLGPAPEYIFGVVTVPVGSYYKSGLKAVDALVLDNYDRAAPLGVGSIKCAGNYGADVKPSKDAAKRGYTISLYLDAKDHKYVEEFSTSNFIAIDKKGAFVTPNSTSVLGSVTNKVLQQLARDMGLKVEVRPVAWDELPSMREIAACGTAVVITPIKSITRGSQVIKCGEINVLQQLYNKVRAIQVGDAADKHGFHRVVM
jgi:branched-chain amino acid aminotransferase